MQESFWKTSTKTNEIRTFHLYDNTFFLLSENLLSLIYYAKDSLHVPWSNIEEGSYEFLCGKNELREEFDEKKVEYNMHQ